MKSVSFVTQCYAKDYNFVLDENRLKQSIFNHNFIFDEILVIINISEKYDEIIEKCENLKSKGVITGYYLVFDYLDKICEHYKITEQMFKDVKSFYLNLYNLAAIYLAKSEYIVFYTGDSICINGDNWVVNSIKLLEKNKNYLTTNLPWGSTPITEHYSENESFYFSKSSFSDQNYMVKKSTFLNPDIIQHKALKNFPHGDTFEMRVYGYMVLNDKIRCIHKTGEYKHENFF